MWIRSRDGKRLICIGQGENWYLEISQQLADGMRNIYVKTLENRYIILGTYKTEERAFEILDEVQELQEDMLSFQLNKWDEGCFFEKHKSMIYQMPEE